ncbi:hypothetical protein BT96DRAFT_793200, partial [Gymnopus androsaceus JB14]
DSTDDRNLFTRDVGPDGAFKPERVWEILKQVKIGPGLSQEQRRRVKELISSYTDCFALSVSEVRAVPDSVHRLNIPENTKFSTKVRQKALTPPQREYLHKKIDELLAAGIIERCRPDEV